MKNLAVLIFILFFPVLNATQAAIVCKNNIPGHDPSRFKSNKDGTVEDLVTDLMWARCDLGAQWDSKTQTCFADEYTVKKFKGGWIASLNEAKKFADTGFAGFNDWRIPNVKEMMTIIALNCLPAVNPSAFPETEASYWTSTPSRQISQYTKSVMKVVVEQRWETSAWTILLQASTYGRTELRAMSDSHFVRLVRNKGATSK